MSAPTHHSRSDGYTMIELIVVLVIAGVMAGFALPRMFDHHPFAERGYADELASALRVAQKTAVASGCNVSFDITAGGYQGSLQAGPGAQCSVAPIVRADGSTLDGPCPASVACPPATQVVFNPRGGLTSGAATVLTVGTHTLAVDGYSGLVTVQ